jgi:hypothetical protein
MHSNQNCLLVWSSSSSLRRHLLCMGLLWESSCHLALANHEQIREPTFAQSAVLQAVLSSSTKLDVYFGPVDRPLNWLVPWTVFHNIIVSSWVLECPCNTNCGNTGIVSHTNWALQSYRIMSLPSWISGSLCIPPGFSSLLCNALQLLHFQQMLLAEKVLKSGDLYPGFPCWESKYLNVTNCYCYLTVAAGGFETLNHELDLNLSLVSCMVQRSAS